MAHLKQSNQLQQQPCVQKGEGAQCDQMWRKLATLATFYKALAFVLGWIQHWVKKLNIQQQIVCAIGQIFIVDQMTKN